MDFAGLLKNDDAEVKQSIALIEGKFPQLKIMFCSLICPEEVKLTTLGWWMLNNGNHSSPPSWTGLFLLDPNTHRITFQAGYDLEIFVNRQKLEALLSECGEWFTLREWSGGITNFFTELYAILKREHKEALKTHKLAIDAIK